MSKNLVIVESPAKARTINKYLGKEFQVLASYGHVRDLVPKEGAVDPEHDFQMKYTVIDKNSKHVETIAKAAKKAEALYLATDPDREGEAISWHLYELLQEKKALDGKHVHRVVFHEITKRAIQDAIAHPRELSQPLINAQQARRALDYLVGFNLSPLLWKKISTGLSAGRVQSPALRMIVERELEIEAFQSREYWTVEADVAKDAQGFVAKLHSFDGERLEQFSIENEARAREVEQALLDAAQGKLHVSKVEKKQRRRNPAAPFTTSTLQQEASRKLGFTTQRTMRIAQQLYEGIDLGQGAVGLITYMRTDSVNLSAEAVSEIRETIAERYGKQNVPAKPQVYRTKAKNAQEAHEAIRPTSARNYPEQVRSKLSDEQYKLYELIWKRAVACQMIHATINTVSVDLTAGAHMFRATGSTVADPGFMAVYQEGQDDKKKEAGEKLLPPLQEGEDVDLKALRPEQHFTEPPPRYSEASLVRALEEHGIGRPSTYATIISTLQQRKYTILENRRFKPTDVGRVVNKFLTDHFDKYVDYDFTARLEDDLDAVSRGERDWVPLMKEFWEPFHTRVEEKAKVSREEVMQAREIGTDPKSGRPVSVRIGRFGPFVQIGTKDDEEKPKFAGLRSHQNMDTITLEEALELFKLPRELGETPEGEPIQVNIGRFGPYVRYANKFVSIKEDDPYTISRERALELIAEKKEADANRIIRHFEGTDIQVLRGRYGPYITDGKKNARMPKDREPESLTLEECQELIAKAPAKKGRGTRSGGKRKSS
ncbi:DNA topoisomerase I [Alkalilimnicola ehrlichii]|uniref:DNA topoisomerase 1 n=1 Tax=Alkalilimnicola ehrlichii TaxID=351052 RepID=A0A3E0WIG4_9GAMM|nr:DNA topoisomerase I [Alkalilimnicola ehrlichii]RFA24756.1 DNA topoisomerase I [Alkalilimnicola ehrlichii]RFA32013.1 DNA topoisomerase I [Alkalilimnicola ehrlichii]